MAAHRQRIGDPRGQSLDRDCRALRRRARGNVAPGRSGHQRFHQRLVRKAPLGDRDHQLVLAFDLQLLDRAGHRFGGDGRGQPVDQLVIDFVPEQDHLVALFVPDEAPHSGARLARRDEAQP